MQTLNQDENTDTKKLLEASLSKPSKMPLTYIREAYPAEGQGFAVCSENGQVLACFNSYDAAFYTARQFRLEPLLVH